MFFPLSYTKKWVNCSGTAAKGRKRGVAELVKPELSFLCVLKTDNYSTKMNDPYKLFWRKICEYYSVYTL